MTEPHPIHWPTFADGLIWCACTNRTFDSEEAWQQHVVDDGIAARLAQPSESSGRHAASDR